MSKTINGVDGVAMHYGFKTAEISPVHIDNESPFCLEEKISTLKSYISNNFLKRDDEVSMIYSQEPLKNNKGKQSPNLKNFSFDIVGIKNGIAEAIIIQTAIVALREEGFKDVSIDINSIGDKESFASFKNELFDYYKKRVTELHSDCRKLNKKNIFDLLTCGHEECQSLRANAPKSIYFLSENSQRHLKEILEHLESTGITYCINDSLIRSGNHFSKVIFEIKSKNEKKGEEILLGKGGRYDELARKVARKKGLTAVGVSLEIKRMKNKQTKLPSDKKPQFYFIQFGPKAKLQSLSLIEYLRQSGLIIKQNLYIDKFSEQIDIAKRSNAPYAIILGQKEASDDTVIVKDLRKASQAIVPTCSLLPYLRQLK